MKVSALTIYPIKALAGIELQSATVTRHGLQYDRRFMLVDQAGKFMTQRANPELTAFSVHLVDGNVVVGYPNGGSVAFPAHPSEGQGSRATVWDDAVDVTPVSKEVDTFFSDVLGSDVRLVGMPESSIRQVDQTYGREQDVVSFADGYPILVLGAASIGELNGRITAKGNLAVPVNRFRPNILISGAEPWKEDTWTAMHFSALPFPRASIRLVKPCARCLVIRTDQKTGQRHAEPLETLVTYRKFGSKVLVGMNAIPEEASLGCVIDVGESFTVSD